MGFSHNSLFFTSENIMFNNRSKAYTEAGVNIQSANSLVESLKKIAASTRTGGVVSDIGGFGGIFRPNLANIKNPLLAASTDGVGTKLKLAFLFKKYDGVGIDLVAMSVNDIIVQGANPLFFLDYYACGKLDPEICLQVISSIAEGCRQAGCALLGGETAEMPGMYPEGEFDLAGFCVGLTDESNLVDGSSARPGDAVIGIASSGAHSNGFSLVRKILQKSGLRGEDPFPLEPDKTVADVLMTPTIIYAAPVKSLLRDLTIRGMAHITGGGFYDNIPRSLPAAAQAKIYFSSWTIPPVFQWLKEEGNLKWPEMLQIFNCGIGFALIMPVSQTEDAINRISAFDLKAWKIGEIQLRDREADGQWGEQVKVIFPDGDAQNS